MPNYPDLDLTIAVHSAIGSWTIGTNMFRGPMRPVPAYIPANAVFFELRGGPTPLNYCDGSTTPQLRNPAVHVQIRSVNHDFLTTQTQIRAIKDALHDVALSGYIVVRVREAEPYYLGEDEAGEHIFAINVDVLYSE